MSEANEKKRIVSPTVTHPRRIPPGQVITRKFPVYDIGPRAVFNKEKLRFVISGEVKEEKMLTWDEFMSFPKVEVFADFHCVTKWSYSAMTIPHLVNSSAQGDGLFLPC